jgi:hypothetical protein
MKLLQRLRRMGAGVEPSGAPRTSEALPGLNRDDFLDPPGEETFEPVLGTQGEQLPGTDASQR